MHRPTKKLLLLSVAALGVQQFASQPPHRILKPLVQLGSQDTLLINYSSRGCFNSFQYTFVFKLGDNSSVTISTIDPFLAPGPTPDSKILIHRKAPKTLGIVALSSTDLTKLDNLFKAYRSNKNQDCTTVDVIDLSFSINGGTKQSEHFTDGSCSISTSQNSSLITLIDLLHRIPNYKQMLACE